MNKIDYIRRKVKRFNPNSFYINRVINKKRVLPIWLHKKLKSITHCQRCHRVRKDLTIHHKISLKDGGTNDESNLIVLCLECHKEIHKDNGDKIYGEMKPRGDDKNG